MNSKEIKVGIADMKIARREGTLITYALGSCIGITLYDPAIKLAGLLHIMLPEAGNMADMNVYKFADTGIQEMLRKMTAFGGIKRRYQCKIAGGAKMFEISGGSGLGNIGQRNIESVHTILRQEGVRLLGTSPESIRKAEDRQGFKDCMESIHQPCVTSLVVESVKDAVAFAEEIGYPVIVRPAYTLGGTGGGIAYDQASLEEIAEAEEEDIAIQCGWGPKEVLSENGKVSGVVFMRCTSVWDSQGRFAPQYDEQDTITVPCDHVVLSIGQSVEWGELLEGSQVELARGGWAKAEAKTYQTAQPDVFVGGDVYTGPKFAIDAIAAGKEAAVSLHRFVQPNTSMTIGRDPRYFVELNKNNIKVEQYDNASRQIPGMDDSFDWKKSFRDAKRTFTEEQVKAETARCLGCGASIVDPNKCIGCGLCTTRCEFDAIHLHRERPECSTMVKSEDKMKAILPNMIKREIKIKRAARKNKK